MSVEQYSLVAHDWLNLEFIINDLTQRVVGQELHPTSSPTFGSGTITGNLAVGGNLGITGDLDIDGTLTLNALTASKLVATDASKGLESVTIGSSLNYTRPTLNTIQDIRTTAVPTFAGMISTGVVRATDFAKTGWPVTPGVTLSFVGGTTRTFTVTDGGSAYYYIDGVKYVLGGNKTVVIDDVEGLWYIYFDGDTLTASQTIWSFLDEDKALVAYLYWARDVGTPANGKSIFTGWELHSFHMSGATHARLHYAGGARWETGLLVSDNEDNTVDVSAGDIWDEDLNISITDDDTPTALFEQILSPAQLSIYYRDGASNWRIYETDEKAALTDVGYLTGGLLQYNDPTTTWSNETVGLNNYVAYYVVATNEQTEPVALIMGQRVDNKLSEAKVNNVFSGLSLDGLPFEEFTVLARLILKDTATYTLEEVLDLRAYNIKGNITSPLITQHAGLGGLNWSSAGHYFDAAVDFNAQNISNIGTVGCGVITQSGATLAATYQPLDDVLTDIAALTEVADNEFIVGTGAGAYAHESGATARTSMGLGTGDSPTFTALTLSTIAAEGTDVDKFLVDSTGVIKYRTGAQILSDIGASASSHLHDGATLQNDAVNSDGGAFSFTTTGAVTFNQPIAATNYAAANLLTACATNAGGLDFTAASKTLSVDETETISNYHTDSRAATWLAANHETTYTHTDIALNTTHRGLVAGNPHSVTPTELGLVIGTNTQAWNAGLDSLAGLTYAAAAYIKMTGANTFALRTIANVRTDLSITNVEDTAISTWAGSGNITTVGALAAGSIAAGFTEIATDYTAAKCTDATADNTAGNETSHADVVVDGDFGSNGILNRTGLGAYSILALGTDVQAYHANLAAIAAGTWTGANSITTLGTISTVGNITVADGGTIGQAAGPLLTFNDTTNVLGITGCNLIINEDISDTAMVGIYSSSEDSDIRIGQGSANNFVIRWKYNATAANAYAWITTDTYNNDLRLDADNIILQGYSAGSGCVGIKTIAPFTDIADGTSDYSGTGLHVKGVGTTRVIVEGAAATLELIDMNSTNVDERIICLANSSGTTRFLLKKQDLTANIDNVLVMKHDTGNVGVGVTPVTKLTAGGTVTLKEQAAADGDTADYGQIWVKGDAPNTLWFTDDEGNDVQLGVGGWIHDGTTTINLTTLTGAYQDVDTGIGGRGIVFLKVTPTQNTCTIFIKTKGETDVETASFAEPIGCTGGRSDTDKFFYVWCETDASGEVQAKKISGTNSNVTIVVMGYLLT